MVLCFSVSTVLPLFDRPLPGPGAFEPPDLLLEGFDPSPSRELGDFLPSSWPGIYYVPQVAIQHSSLLGKGKFDEKCKRQFCIIKVN